jgi:hypothetical protein
MCLFGGRKNRAKKSRISHHDIASLQQFAGKGMPIPETLPGEALSECFRRNGVAPLQVATFDPKLCRFVNRVSLAEVTKAALDFAETRAERLCKLEVRR